MAPAKLRLERIIWRGPNGEPFITVGDSDADAFPGCDGAVYYEVLWPCACEPACVIACAEHPTQHHGYLMQPFTRSDVDRLPNLAPLWKWDGDREAPTLTPSFLSQYPRGGDLPQLRVHLFLTAGRIVLCSDSNVELAEG